MALRGKQPTEKTRLRALLSGQAGVGKTMAAIQMPKPYLIDAESGLEHYGDMVKKNGGVVFATDDVEEIINEVKALTSEKHDYLTLVIDPLTVVYERAVDTAITTVGDAFGKHTAHAGRQLSRLMSLIANLDMNVVLTSHAKPVYTDGEMKGFSFDGWKKSDYIVDVHFHLDRRDNGQRIAEVRKTRLSGFEDGEKFEWSYKALAERYGQEKLERGVINTSFASQEQIDKFTASVGRLSDDEKKAVKVGTIIKKYNETLEDMPAATADKWLQFFDKYFSKRGAA